MTAVPDLAAVKDYLGMNTAATDKAITDALAAETAAQAKACKLPDEYTADLATALKRRVARHLAVKNLPLGIQASFADGAVQTNRIYGTDPEVARLERPYRKVVIR